MKNNINKRMKKKVKNLKLKVKYLQNDYEDLENRIIVFEDKERNRRNLGLKIMRTIIVVSVVFMAATYFYSVYFK